MDSRAWGGFLTFFAQLYPHAFLDKEKRKNSLMHFRNCRNYDANARITVGEGLAPPVDIFAIYEIAEMIFVLTHGPKEVSSPLWNRTPGGKKKLAKAFLTEFRQKLGGRVAVE